MSWVDRLIWYMQSDAVRNMLPRQHLRMLPISLLYSDVACLGNYSYPSAFHSRLCLTKLTHCIHKYACQYKQERALGVTLHVHEEFLVNYLLMPRDCH